MTEEKTAGFASAGPEKMVLAILVVAVVVGASALGYVYLSREDVVMDDDLFSETVVLSVVGKDGVTTNLTLSDMTNFSAHSGVARAQNAFGNWRGHGNYTGVSLADLVEHAGGMGPGDTVRVVSDDGYSQSYTYYNVYPDWDWREMQGEYVLAYSFNGTGQDSWEKFPKLVCLPEDGEFSSSDANWTSAVGLGYSVTNSAASLWLRNVEQIIVTAGNGDWSITLEGDETKILSGTEFDMFKRWYPSHHIDDRGRNWSGTSLTNILGLVDGGERRGEGAYNHSYLPTPDSQGYDVQVSARDGFTRYFGNTNVSDLFLADAMNGTPLGLTQGPLRLIAPGMRSGNWVGQVDFISIEPRWDLTLIGWDHDKMDWNNRTITYSELVAMASVTGTAYAYKVSYPHLPITGPFNYTGVPLMSLVERVWNKSYDFTLEIEADDGNVVSLNSSETAGRITTYDMDKNDLGVQHVQTILAYEMDGKGWFNGGPLRLMFVNDAGAVTDIGLWNKGVNTLRIVERVDEWELSIVMNMTGRTPSTVTFSRSEFEHAFHKAHSASVTLGDDFYQGMPLWILVGAVDGNDTYDGDYFYHWGFNDSLAAEGYNITVFAGDKTNSTFTSQQVARNDSMVLAQMLNDERLSGNSWPLQLVGATLSGGERVRNVIRIEIVDAL